MLLRVIGIVAALLHSAGAFAADTPAQVQALQEHLRAMIDAAEPGIAAIVVSSNPVYDTIQPVEKSRPGVLGGYIAKNKPTDGIVPAERDRLDLKDARNAADNSFGSGIVIDRDGRVLTSYHLIENAKKIYVRYADGSGSYADIHAADARSDLAVLRTQPQKFQKPVKFAEVRLGDSLKGEKANVFRGQFVIAMAHPFAAGFNDGKASASWGMISNVRRRATPPASDESSRDSYLYQYSDLLQTDARLNLGSSGGGLFNLDGELIGLLTATAAVAGSETSGGYAVPMDPIYRRIVEVLKEGREVEYGFLGVRPDYFEEAETRRGLVLKHVSPGTPAAAKDIKDADVIQAVDGRPLRDKDDLFLLVGGSLAGTEITLSVLRGTEKLTKKVRLWKFGHTLPVIASVRPEAVFGLRVDYLSTQRVEDYRSGVIIRESEIEPGSPAAAKLKRFLGGSTIITRVNGKSIRTPAEFYEAAKGARSVTLTLSTSAEGHISSESTITLP